MIQAADCEGAAPAAGACLVLGCRPYGSDQKEDMSGVEADIEAEGSGGHLNQRL